MFRFRYRLHLTRDQINTIMTELDVRKRDLSEILEHRPLSTRDRKRFQNKIITINDALLALQDWEYVRIETNEEE